MSHFKVASLIDANCSDVLDLRISLFQMSQECLECGAVAVHSDLEWYEGRFWPLSDLPRLFDDLVHLVEDVIVVCTGPVGASHGLLFVGLDFGVENVEPTIPEADEVGLGCLIIRLVLVCQFQELGRCVGQQFGGEIDPLPTGSLHLEVFGCKFAVAPVLIRQRVVILDQVFEVLSHEFFS